MLKLKTSRFASRTRAARLSSPTVLPDRLFDLARVLLAKEATGTEFRLIGIGANPLVPRRTRTWAIWLTRPRPGAPPRRPQSIRCAAIRRCRDRAWQFAAMTDRFVSGIGDTEMIVHGDFAGRFAHSRSDGSILKIENHR